MPKRVFWPAALVVMGLVFLASNLGMLPREFWNLWPLMLIIVGLGGLLTSDTNEWYSNSSTSSATPASKTRRPTPTKKTSSKKKKR